MIFATVSAKKQIDTKPKEHKSYHAEAFQSGYYFNQTPLKIKSQIIGYALRLFDDLLYSLQSVNRQR